MKVDTDLHPIKVRTQEIEMPNKLVKRSISHRVLSTTELKASFFRRPATSHRRSASLIPTSNPQQASPASTLPLQTRPLAATAPSWRPYFESGYPRKRHTSETGRDGAVRTVSTPYLRRPTLVNAQVVERQENHDDVDDARPRSGPSEPGISDRRQRLRRSLSSFRKPGRQRNFTEPTVRVFKEEAQGSILPTTRQSPLSPVSRSSTFNFELPHGTPVFASSPPVQQLPAHHIAVHKRVSAARSDFGTTSSDNDTRVFTDDDSMEFQSDSAYDSLATRATASSHSGYRQPKIEAIFAEPIFEQGERGSTSLEDLMQRSTLDDQHLPSTAAWTETVGIGISGLSHAETRHNPPGPRATTPIKISSLSSIEELTATPVALNHRAQLIDIPSSSPPSVLRHPMSPTSMPKVHYPEDMDVDGSDSIDWSPKSNQDSPRLSSILPISPELQHTAQRQTSHNHPVPENKRSSIFDWSEQQKDSSNGFIPRPRTVHGKHVNDAGRSRAAGRKSTNTTHLRSQSVPVTRESTVDGEATPSAATKFGTWGLGNKPVSEEWSDDFEFDDMEEVKDTKPVEIIAHGSQGDSMRSVKVPQTILDRQASVHLQFGQVQEFMMLVDELKRLRSLGVTLDILEGPSRQLWEDAENIISLATLNDEDEGQLRPPSPISSDIFGDENSPSSRRISIDEKRDFLSRRSISNPATPPYGRPRGESLMQAKSFLQTIHQNRNGIESSPAEVASQPREKLPFDTQDLRDLVIRAGVINRALKEIVRKAEGVSVSPQRTPQKVHDPTLSHIFNPPELSPCPPFRKPGLPKSRSANSYLCGPVGGSNENDMPPPLKFTAVIEAN